MRDTRNPIWIWRLASFANNTAEPDEPRVREVHYLLDEPTAQIRALTSGVMRSKLPGLGSDAAYSDVEEIAPSIERTLGERMEEYEYMVVKSIGAEYKFAARR
jgi:hypothetical protein